MPEPTAVGLALTAIKKASGMSWPELARTLGASSGDYVRKVASGAKPGRNLAGNVETFQQAGRVYQPVPRRKAPGTGLPARVRARGGSRVPEPTQLRRRVRGQYGETTTYARGGATAIHHVELPRTEGIGRERGREAVMRIVRQAARDGKRVRFVLARQGGDSTPLGRHGGYDPRGFLQRAHAEGDDPLAVLFADGEDGSGQTDAAIIGVDVEVY